MNEETLRLLRESAEMAFGGEIPEKHLGNYHTLWEGICPFCDSDVHRTHELDFDPSLIGWVDPGDGGWTTESCWSCDYPTRLYFEETIKYF